MLNKSFVVIYFHFNIFSEKNSKKQVKIHIFGFLQKLSQNGPKHTTSDLQLLMSPLLYLNFWQEIFL